MSSELELPQCASALQQRGVDGPELLRLGGLQHGLDTAVFDERPGPGGGGGGGGGYDGGARMGARDAPRRCAGWW